MRETGTRKPLRLLQVGMGGWGRDWAWRIVPGVRSVRLVGCVDLSQESLELARLEMKIPADRLFTSLERALAATDPDAVLVTTLLPGHVTVARTALEAGKHVLVEKPFAPSLSDAVDLVRLAAERGRILMVSQNYRFFPAVRAVKRIVTEGKLGELGQVWIEFRRHSPIPPGGPRTHHAYDHPLLMDMSIHHFDLLRFLLGREPTSVSCYTWNSKWTGFSGPPSASASIEFDGGVTASYRGSWISSGSITPWAGEWRMQFERGEVMWTSRGDESTVADVVVVQRGGREPEVMRMPRVGHIDRWGTLAEFADAVRQHREPQCSGRENLGSLALMFAAVESAGQRKPVPVRAPLD
jgi:predicted dehydrogenase